MKKVAINGFGRIGRLAFRQLIDRADIEVVAINDLTDNTTLAHLLKYDSAQGTFHHEVSADDSSIYVDGHTIKALSDKNPANLPWGELDVDVVLECTGFFRRREDAQLHLDAGAKRVVISAPAKSGDVLTIVLGVNDDEIDPGETIFSNASCTTNCLAPLLKVVDENWGIVSGFVTTIHAYTSTQRIQDSAHKDLRRARAGAFNIIPTTTGAAKASTLVYPSVKGKIKAMAYRVPVITGSLVEFDATIAQVPANAAEVNAVFKAAAAGAMKGVLHYTEDPIVSSDIIGDRHSSIFDSLLTELQGDMIKIVSWYDNEAGYASRLVDMGVRIAHL